MHRLHVAEDHDAARDEDKGGHIQAKAFPRVDIMVARDMLRLEDGADDLSSHEEDPDNVDGHDEPMKST